MADAVLEDERWEEALADAGGPAALSQSCHDAAEAELAALRLRAGTDNAASLEGEVAVLFADDARIHTLNRTFRGVDKPTNVLSFPSGDFPAGDDGPEPPGERALGDIALGFETCRREAREKNLALSRHAAHLIVHGLLHLVGYDHQMESEAETMEALETRVLARLGVPDPYAVPAGAEDAASAADENGRRE